MKTKLILFIYLPVCLLLLTLTSCEKALDVQPKNFVVADKQFATDAKANDAVVGIYATMAGINSVTTYSGNIALFTGLSADELTYNLNYDNEKQFYNNALVRTNAGIQSLWTDSYSVIFQANSVIENVAKSAGISQAGKNQFTGEAKFIRAFCYFYLVNMYGDVPLVTETNYHKTSTLPRVPVKQVYQQITADLTDAYSLLSDNYPTDGRVRANKSAAAGLLARVYLYNQDWANAEKNASELIGNSKYTLENSYSVIFQQQSQEAILQLWMPEGYTYFQAAAAGISGFSVDVDYSVTDEFLNSFESNDARKAAFTDTITLNGTLLNFPHKYRNDNIGGANPESYMMLRLAEQYLIRAEARTMQNNITGAVNDVNLLRARAGLPGVTQSISRADMLLVLEKERRAELCYEWGDRWFNLKRTGRINAVLGAKKTGWKNAAALFPIPQTELQNNPSLTQNPGY